MHEKNFKQEWAEEKFIGLQAENFINAILVLEAFDKLPPIKTTMAPSLEELIRRMANNPNTAQKILRRVVQKLDYLEVDES